MDIHQQLSEFLMTDLAASVDDFEDESLFVYSVAVNIAIVGSQIQESLLRMYIQPVMDLVNINLMYASLAYFGGADILNIECDCSGGNMSCLTTEVRNDPFYVKGASDKLVSARMYEKATSDVLELRSKIY